MSVSGVNRFPSSSTGDLIKRPRISKEVEMFSKAINATAVNLYQQMSEVRVGQHKNFLFFTPNLIASLSMLYAGAPDELRAEMEQALHMGELKGEKWHSLFQNWSESILNHINCSMLKTDQVRPLFQQTQIMATCRGAKLTHQARVSLTHYSPEIFSCEKPEEAQKLINERVAAKTEGKIANLIEDVKADLALILASTALFKGQWQHPFNKSENSEEVFYNSDETCVFYEMMNMKTDNLKMAHDWKDKIFTIELLELPFHGDVSLLLIKPAFRNWRYHGERFQKVENCAKQLKEYMTVEHIQGVLDKYEDRFEQAKGLTLGVPKVMLQEKTDMLKDLAHTSLGQKLAIANFTSTLVEANQEAKIDKLVSEVNFTMDEEGAAVTAASYSPTYLMSCDPEFKLNAPFGLAIVDLKTRTLLGMGQVLKLDGVEAVQKITTYKNQFGEERKKTIWVEKDKQ